MQTGLRTGQTTGVAAPGGRVKRQTGRLTRRGPGGRRRVGVRGDRGRRQRFLEVNVEGALTLSSEWVESGRLGTRWRLRPLFLPGFAGPASADVGSLFFDNLVVTSKYFFASIRLYWSREVKRSAVPLVGGGGRGSFLGIFFKLSIDHWLTSSVFLRGGWVKLILN